MSASQVAPRPHLEDGENLTIEEKIRQAQKVLLRDISIRNRSRGQNNTTSLRDLCLARRHVAAPSQVVTTENRPQASDEGWASSSNPWNVTSARDNSHQNTPHSVQPTDDVASHYDSHGLTGEPNAESSELPTTSLRSHLEPSDKGKSKAPGTEASAVTRHDKKAIVMPTPGPNHIKIARSPDLESVHASMDAMSNNAASWILSDIDGARDQGIQSGQVSITAHDAFTSGLLAYNGYMCPPPVDWNERPAFNKYDAAFRNTLMRWMEDAARRTNDELKFRSFPRQQITDPNLQPDGLGFVSLYTTINKTNARSYGYRDDEDITKYAQPVSTHNFEDWGKLDPRRPENQLYKDECTEDYVRNWTANIERERAIRQARDQAKLKAKEPPIIYTSDISPHQPEINIYIRPALKCDVPQLTWIYNHYVAKGSRTAELEPIQESEMLDRLVDTQSSELPFVVACLRNSKSIIRPNKQARQRNRNLANGRDEVDADPIEKVVGWSSANDFTAQRFAERISIEMEMYVHPSHRQKGVAKCLMDQMLQAIDCGHIRLGGYPFTCAPEIQHVYDRGGARDVRKVIMLIRKYTYPVDGNGWLITNPKDLVRKPDEAKLDDLENDFDFWMKSWLETCGFRVEATLSEVGARKGRYIDLVYMTRETMWRPSEGTVPDPFQGSA